MKQSYKPLYYYLWKEMGENIKLKIFDTNFYINRHNEIY